MKELPKDLISDLWEEKILIEYKNYLIYGNSHPHIYIKPTRWERLKWKALEYKRRIRGAWLVLIGKAEIYEDD